ncbi:MAG: 50S ribosomal protein L25/general stress protein Ctc [Bacteroidales bacterium]|nr:50S ribosomal protein L25/general stress protein Ctc [Bacteroidales bacterium]MDY2914480.1 50S ribosomal protein L25/general stress protein Ctc [Alloprevotella sp.]MCI6727025.1 50S ribosomal protein L25/general stress protein Ctc [Bacteroidales bacterium]MCI7614439.1 50S ribosomal protein L25/general stress protein Ctc [Bacteroidales bacterium]MDD6594356.1 50S ribosomal protein L25/general stress protein Ctc [Bacteroidales bacterium]
MREFSINGSVRANLGKKATKEVRKNGLVPCVMYGEKRDENGLPVATHFVVNEKEINKIYFTPHVYLVNINIDGVEHKAIVKEVQCHPVKDNVLHVDFYEVVANRPIVVGVPIAPKGLAEGVRAGGKLMAMIRKINVKATYDLIPEKLDIDVTNLGLGKSIKVGDLSFEGLELVTPKEVIVCTVKMTRAAMGALAAANKG